LKNFYNETLGKTLEFCQTKVKTSFLVEKTLEKIDKRLITIIRMLKNIMLIEKMQEKFPPERNMEWFDDFYKLDKDILIDSDILAKEILS